MYGKFRYFDDGILFFWEKGTNKVRLFKGASLNFGGKLSLGPRGIRSDCG